MKRRRGPPIDSREREEFQDRLDRAIDVVLQELRDGCCDCSELGDSPDDEWCLAHFREAYNIAAHPQTSVEVQKLLKRSTQRS